MGENNSQASITAATSKANFRQTGWTLAQAWNTPVCAALVRLRRVQLSPPFSKNKARKFLRRKKWSPPDVGGLPGDSAAKKRVISGHDKPIVGALNLWSKLWWISEWSPRG